MNQNTLAHSIWKDHLQSQKKRPLCLVDATCGNGHDSYFLSNFDNMELHCMDIQKTAIENTKKRLSSKEYRNFYFHLSSHENLSFIKRPIDLIVYNLGYLPGSNKTLITTQKSTILSLETAISKLSPTGMISIMIYTGHLGGIEEKDAIINFISTLKNSFSISSYVNPLKSMCPELIILCRLNIKILLE